MKNLILFFCFVITISCSTNNSSQPISNFTTQTITPTFIGKGINSGTAIQSNFVITSQVNWLLLMDSLTSANTSNFTETNIDFNNFQLLVAIDNTRPDTGYSINISTIIENTTTISALVTSTNNGNGFSVLSRPFYIVKIPKSTKPVLFQ